MAKSAKSAKAGKSRSSKSMPKPAAANGKPPKSGKTKS